MSIETTNKVELKLKKEDREYVLLVPIGAQMEEAKDVALYFASTLIATWEKNKEEIAKAKEKEESEKDPEKKEELIGVE